MADQSNAEGVDLEHISLKDLFTQINSMKRDIDSGLDIIKTNMESLRLKIQHDMKMMKTDIEEVKRSVNRSWEEIEEMKSLMSKQREDVDVMKAEILLLKGQVKKERDRNTRLEQYTRRENIRQLNVKETEDENTEALFKKVLTEMGVNVDGLRFHAVHRVGPVREARQSLITEKRQTSRHIIARFLCRQNRNMVWESRDRIKETENFREAFFVPDLCKEYAEESYILRQALKIARGKYNIERQLSNNKLVMTDSGLAYSAEQLPDYLNVKKKLVQQ